MKNIDKYNSGNYCGLRVSVTTDGYNPQYAILAYNKLTKSWEEVYTLTTKSTAPVKLLNKYYNWLRCNALLNNEEMKYLQGLIDDQTNVVDVNICMNNCINPYPHNRRLELIFVYNDGVVNSIILPSPSLLFNPDIKFSKLEINRTYSYLELGLSLPE